MGEATEISWSHSTWNPWWGCTRVSPGCDHCYAETFARRLGMGIWGRDEPRRFFGEKHWAEPLRWERKAAASGEPWRVFCASMADVFEANDYNDEAERVDGWPVDAGRSLDTERRRLWDLIEATPNLTWMILTKRPENVMRMVPIGWGSSLSYPTLHLGWPRNLWVGTSVENQRYADLRIPKLLAIPAPVRFLSCEPLLGPVDLTPWLPLPPIPDANYPDGLTLRLDVRPAIGWVIVGGESGPKARPMHPAWARSLRDQCVNAGVPYHLKQWGEYGPAGSWHGPDHHVTVDGRLFRPGEPGVDQMLMPAAMHRWGKKIAGRLLDGREWAEFPTNRGGTNG